MLLSLDFRSRIFRRGFLGGCPIDVEDRMMDGVRWRRLMGDMALWMSERWVE